MPPSAQIPRGPSCSFLQLGVSHALIARVPDRIFETQEAPFTGRRRKLVVHGSMQPSKPGSRGRAPRYGWQGRGAFDAWVGELLSRMR